eukprot:1369041-Amorphochlora_amoeboformis.AAC.2
MTLCSVFKRQHPLRYYKGNYALLLIGFTIFGLCIHPEAFVTVVVSLIAIAVLLILKIETSPGHIVSPEMKLAVSLPVVFVMLLRAGITPYRSTTILGPIFAN